MTILKDLKKLSHILPGVRHHHESIDGTGYPDHLSGEEIPLEARILAVADSFDAMSSNRPYRKRLSLMQIDKIFRKGRGHAVGPRGHRRPVRLPRGPRGDPAERVWARA